MSGISFLDSTAKTLYQKYGNNISRCCLVFPGRRAGLFFQEDLAKHLEREIWMPESMSIRQLTEMITGEKTTEHLFLLIELYKLYTELTAKDQGLEEFYSLGNILLHDFDQTDKYLLDTAVLFHNIKDLKRIGQDFSFLSPEQQQVLSSFWSSFHFQPDHPLNLHFMSVWEILPQLYTRFNEILRSKGFSYEGMIYRKMANMLEEGKDNDFPNRYSRFVFIGFNALNTCEKKLFRFLRNKDKADFFWDYDPYYIEDPVQEAGLFLRENLKEFPPPGDYNKDHSLLQSPRNIKVIPVTSYVMQAKIVPGIIRKYALPLDKRTAVVLADEDLLLPLLYGLGTLTKDRGDMNVTMGFPLCKTTLYSLLDSLLKYYNQTGSTRDFRPVKMHPYVQTLDLQDSLQNVPENALELYERFIYLLDHIDTSEVLSSADVMLLPVARETRKLLNKLHLSLTLLDIEIGITVFAKLIRQHLSQASVPFSGEPLSGLQVMGFLETRCLDFENLIIVSAQENQLPKAYKDNSIIPYNIRKAFGLPATDQHTAMQAYYFYRLLQRAQNVFLIWNSNPDGYARGEMSRFIRQISFELPASSVTINPLTYTHTLPEVQPVLIPKTGMVKDILKEYLDQGKEKFLSPTALETYIRCPLKFYYRYVMVLKEPGETLEEADSLHTGNIVHAVLETLYRPFLGKTLERGDILAIIHPEKKFRDIVTGVADKYLEKKKEEGLLIEKGKWILFTEVAILYAERFIRYDASRTPLKIIAVEKRFSCRYRRVGIAGIIDRMDIREGNLHLIDYKTGVAKNSFSLPTDLFDSRLSARNGDVFQILCYVFLYGLTHPGPDLPLPLLFYLNAALRGKEAGMIRYNRQKIDNQAELTNLRESFLSLLNLLLEELFNFNAPFRQTDFIDNCTFCPYSSMCQREKYND